VCVCVCVCECVCVLLWIETERHYTTLRYATLQTQHTTTQHGSKTEFIAVYTLNVPAKSVYFKIFMN